METIQARLAKKGDLWKNMDDNKIIMANNKSMENIIK
jgi:hypothetical protein